jgi:hypothetical protein
MKTYFSRIVADHWCAKNKLEEAAHKLAHEMDRQILTEDQVPAYKAEFLAKIDQLNALFSRCKPLRFSFELSKHHPEDMGDYSIWCDRVFNMCLFLAK